MFLKESAFILSCYPDSKAVSTGGMYLPKEDYEAIEKAIYSDESVVGIDAKKTHIIIIHMLQQIKSKLNELEKRLDAQK